MRSKLRKRMWIKRIGIMLLIMGIMTIPGCGKEDEDNHKPIVFGATYMTRNNVFFDVLHEGIEEVVESNGDILISLYSSHKSAKRKRIRKSRTTRFWK